MSDIIHLLSDAVANQIAAGEVIQRPASVLKELVENAIDAGATNIRVVIKDAGRTLLQVTDNGKGMSETDARMAFERHATSKIKDANDLFSLRTMGFRGEALASIAAVAQVEMRTRRPDDELGVMIEIAGSRVFKQENVQCDAGTTFLIKNLFFNVPARRRFLKSDNVEKAHIINEFYRIVLVHADIEFSLYDGDDELYNLPASSIKMRIEHVFSRALKKKMQQQLLPIDSATNLISISGFVGRPEFAQKSANQYFFVNGRYMRHPYFHKAVMMAYNQMIQSTDNPNYFIYFEVPPDSIDINIHPTKTEIKFENEQAIWSILTATVKESLGKFNVAPSIDFDTEGAFDMPIKSDVDNIMPPKTNFNPDYNPFKTSGSSMGGSVGGSLGGGGTSSGGSGGANRRPDMDWEQLYQGFESKKFEPAIAPSNETPEVQHEEIVIQSKMGIDEVRASNYQFKNKYIITAIKSGLLLIDQHRAHVRIMFDKFIADMERRKAPSQQILFPEVLDLNSEDFQYFESIREKLQFVGFDFDMSHEQRVEVTGTPSHIPAERALVVLLELIDNAKHTAIDAEESMNAMIALSLAESAAIRSGQTLNNDEMDQVLAQLFSSTNPNYSPDGKAISTVIGMDEIAARLK